MNPFIEIVLEVIEQDFSPIIKTRDREYLGVAHQEIYGQGDQFLDPMCKYNLTYSFKYEISFRTVFSNDPTEQPDINPTLECDWSLTFEGNPIELSSEDKETFSRGLERIVQSYNDY